VNILLIGADSRSGLGDITSGKQTGTRADTMMLVHVAGNRKSVQVMSIMRDLWVDVPGHGEAKINAAFSWGGVPLAVQTIEQLLGTRIDHVASIDFGGFAEMSTAVGGVDVASPVAFTSKNMSGYTFEKGINHLEGQKALAFVRERYAFASGDFQRVQNQQAFMKGLLTTVTTVDGFPDVGMLGRFFTATAPHVRTDDGLNLQALVSLGYGLRTVRASDVDFFTLPTSGTGTSADGQSIVLGDPAAIADLAAALQADDLTTFVRTAGLVATEGVAK
jgi:LCP family protein required for cell wall assembly